MAQIIKVKVFQKWEARKTKLSHLYISLFLLSLRWQTEINMKQAQRNNMFWTKNHQRRTNRQIEIEDIVAYV